MPREDSASKARRYLAEGRLNVVYVKPHDVRVRALCRGESGETYKLGYDNGKWFCSCPALTVKCAHLNGLKLVTRIPSESPF